MPGGRAALTGEDRSPQRPRRRAPRVPRCGITIIIIIIIMHELCNTADSVEVILSAGYVLTGSAG